MLRTCHLRPMEPNREFLRTSAICNTRIHYAGAIWDWPGRLTRHFAIWERGERWQVLSGNGSFLKAKPPNVGRLAPMLHLNWLVMARWPEER